jgi:hypothetical protein
VHDQRANQLRVARDELEADRPAAAVPIGVRGLVPGGSEDRRGILDVRREDVPRLAFERAA